MAAEIHERQIAGIRGGRDKHGVATLTLPLWARSYEECYSLGPTTIFGLPEFGREWTEGEGGLLTVQITYGGEVEGSGGGAGGAGGGSEAGAIGRVTYALKPKFGEEPIETHPLLKELMEKYGGEFKDGRVVFPPEWKGASSGGSGLGGRRNQDAQRNPMAGVEKWKPVEVTWHREYAAREIPGDILSRIGRVIGSPPGNPPEIPGRTKWLVVCPDYEDAGNVKRISEVYELLPEDVPEEFYRAYQA